MGEGMYEGMYEVPISWSCEEGEDQLKLRRSFSFRSQKRLLDFVRSVLELSHEFVVNPKLEIFLPKVTVELVGALKERDRLSIFAMAIDDLFMRFSS